MVVGIHLLLRLFRKKNKVRNKVFKYFINVAFLSEALHHWFSKLIPALCDAYFFLLQYKLPFLPDCFSLLYLF